MKRYARHIVLKKIGVKGQRKLLDARVLVAGAGGLGSPAALYMAAAGIGTIGIADGDVVELSNLQRQIMYSAADVGMEKTRSAAEAIRGLNSDVSVNIYDTFLSSQNIMEIIDPYDFILDCTDNVSSKFLINDACVIAEKPFVHAGIGSFYGQIMTYAPGAAPCCRCVFGDPDEADDAQRRRGGVIGAVCGVIGSLQAMEAIKYIIGIGDLLSGRILTYDALTAEFRTLKTSGRVDDCPVCGTNPTITEIGRK
jgi:molybdopterin/thiamine biosynthesis adenylyltransferase